MKKASNSLQVSKLAGNTRKTANKLNDHSFWRSKHDLICHVASSIIFEIERFSFERRKVIGFAITMLRDWLKKLAPLFQLIRKLKPIATHSHAFSRALHELHVITTSFDWFTVMFMALVIG